MKSNKKSLTAPKNSKAPIVAAAVADKGAAGVNPAGAKGLVAAEKVSKGGGGTAGKAVAAGVGVAGVPKAVAAKAGVATAPVAKAKVAASVAPAGGERQIAAAVPAAASVAEANPTKASTAKAGGASARKAPPVVTTIEVRYDVGLGNQLFIRGGRGGIELGCGLADGVSGGRFVGVDDGQAGGEHCVQGVGE